jgi:four helix bundle protein
MIEKKKYDLEDRTFLFSRNIRRFIQKLPRSILLQNDITQLLRSSASIGANYIEANESLGKKDFAMRVKICRKEAKETIYWLKLISEQNFASLIELERSVLEKEATELMHIFGAIVSKIS